MKSYYSFIITAFVLLCEVSSYSMMPQTNYTPDEAQMMQEYEQLQKGIEEYLSTLSPEEQQAFYETQRMYEEMFSQMSEEELNQYLEEMYRAAEEEMQQYYASLEANQVPEQPTNPQDIELPIQEVKPTIEYSKYTEIIQIIESILTKTESFLVKVNSIPDIAQRVNQWVQKKAITRWPENTTWAIFLHTVEFAHELIMQMLEKNPKTAAFKHLDAVLESAPLNSLLRELNTVLQKNEPLIKIASFGLEPMTKETKEALKAVINAYLEYEEKIRTSDELQKVLVKFDTEAQKLKQEELNAIRLAEGVPTASVLPAAGSMGTTSGGSYIGGGYSGGSYNPYGGGGSYNPSYSGGGSYPNYGSSTPSGSTGSIGTPGGAGGSTPGGDTKKPTDSKTEKKVREKDMDTERILGRFELVFNEMISNIKENKEFSSGFKANITDAAGIIDEKNDFTQFKIPALSKLVNSCLTEINALARKVRSLSDAIQKGYKDDVKSMLSSVGGPVTQLISEIKNAANYWVSIPQDKRKVYFGSIDIPTDIAPKPVASSPVTAPLVGPSAIPAQPVAAMPQPATPIQQEEEEEEEEEVTKSMDVTTGLPQPVTPAPISLPTPTPTTPVASIQPVSQMEPVNQLTPTPVVAQPVALPPVSIPATETGGITLITLLKTLTKLIDSFNNFPII